MEISRHESGSKGSFTAKKDDMKAGEMTYSIAGQELIIIDHTEVEEQFRGGNVGHQLLLALVDYTRKNNIKVIPLCPFAKAMFAKKKDIQDVLKS